jgi:hypothetical protein
MSLKIQHIEAILILVFQFAFADLLGQPFQSTSNIFKAVEGGQSIFSDLDNDGDLDLLISGSEGLLTYYTRIYNNNGSGVFTETSQKLPGIQYGSIDVGDFNRDGLIDVLIVGGVSGTPGSQNKGTKLFKNKGAFSFEEVLVGLPDLNQGMARFGDYDNDGDEDILLAGSNLTDLFHDIYRNDNGVFSPLGLMFPSSYNPAISWADYDSDGDLDYVFSGKPSETLTIYKNTGNDTFLPISLGQPALIEASLEWGDYNNDGKLDLVAMGFQTDVLQDVLYVLKNIGGDTFERNSTGFTGSSLGNISWGDFDNDGDLDLVSTGAGYLSGQALTCLYLNNNGSFSKQTFNLPQISYSHIGLGDVDNDLDIDLIITGGIVENNLAQPQSSLYINNTSLINTPPSAPLNLQSSVDGQRVTLSWNQALDTQTPQQALTYNIYVGTSSGLDNSNSSLSNISNGSRKIVWTGNAASRTSRIIDNLTSGNYYWSVQSIDGNYIGSAFSSEKTFSVQNEFPVIQTFAPTSAIAGATITITGKNFIGTSSIEINGLAATFKVVNSTSILATVPDGNSSGNIKVTNIVGATTSTQSFCIVPVVSYIIGSNTLCANADQLYQVSPVKVGVAYRWSIIGDGTIIENLNDRVKLKWNSGGNYSLSVTPESCQAGAKKTINVTVQGPASTVINGSLQPKTETTEIYYVPSVNQETYEWSLSYGGVIVSSTNQNGITVKWTQPGQHTLKLLRSNAQCPSAKVENTWQVNVALAAFSFSTSLPAEIPVDLAVADFDNDADMDMLSLRGKLYENKGSQVFQERALALPLATKMKTFDFDNDNDVDILLVTLRNFGGLEIQVYENQGSFNFVLAWKSIEAFFSTLEINFIDYDNDGDQDIVNVGDNSLLMYENIGSKKFQKTSVSTGYHAYQFTGTSSVIDLDQNGFMDVVTSKGGVFLNFGLKNFVPSEIDYLKDYYAAYSGQYSSGIPKKNLIWEDLTNDGIPDLIEIEGKNFKINKKVGNTFVNIYSLTLQSLFSSKMIFMDLNNDGFKDMIFDGFPSQIRYYDYNSKSYTTEVQSFSTYPLRASPINLFDSNQDGSIDLLLTSGNSSNVNDLFVNNLKQATITPVPNELNSKVEGEQVTLNWSGQLGNTFNIIVGTQPDLSDIVSPLSDLSSGQQKILSSNAGGSMSRKLTLPPGTYYWGVQSINPNLKASAFSPRSSFTISPSILARPTNLALYSSLAEISLSWTDNALAETGYSIERSSGDANFVKIGEVGSNISTYVDATAISVNSYFYRVKAINPLGDSFYSNIESTDNAVISTIPYQESFESEQTKWTQLRSEDEVDLKGIPNPLYTIGNNWERQRIFTGGVDGNYALYMPPIGSPSASVLVSPYFDLSKTLNPYLIFSVNVNDQSYQGSIAGEGCYVQVSKDNGLTWINANGYYIYHNTSGKWERVLVDLSSFRTIKTKIRIVGKLPANQYYSPYLYLDNIKIVESPLAPKNIKVTQFAPNQLNISWDKSVNATHYVIERKISSGSFIAIDTISSPVTSLTDSNLTVGTNYTYRVYAYNNIDNTFSFYSNVVNKTIIIPPIIIEPIGGKSMKTFQLLTVPVAITYGGLLNTLQYSVISSNSTLLPSSKISLEPTSTGLNCKINADSQSTGSVSITIMASNGTYTAENTFNLSILDSRIGQQITFINLPEKKIGYPNFALEANASSGLSVTFTSSNNSVASINGNIVTILSVGSTIITAFQEGNDVFSPAIPVAQMLTIKAKNSQTITFNDLSNKIVTDNPFDLNASSSSGLTISYSSSNNQVATINGNTLTIVGAGSATIKATQIGDADYEPAIPVERTLQVNKASQSITFSSLPPQSVIDKSFVLKGTASSGLPVSYSSSNLQVATIIGNMVTIVGVGSTTISASQNGNNQYNASTFIEQTLIVNKANQIITFGALASKLVNDSPFSLNATTSSGLPINYYSSNPSVATIEGNTVSIISAGNTEITALQIGNELFNKAESVTNNLTISRVSQRITFKDLPQNSKIGDVPILMDASSSSGLPVSFVSSDLSVAKISGNQLIILGAGESLITAVQNGDGTYEAAVSVSQSFRVALVTAIEPIAQNLPTSLLYPNPANSWLNINLEQFNPSETVRISMHDSYGRLISINDFKKEKLKISLEDLAIGMYYIHLSQGTLDRWERFIKY